MAVVLLIITMVLASVVPHQIVYADDTDWSVKLCDSILVRYTPSTFGPWEYNQGLVLEGMWRVYQRTGNIKYYNFIKNWVDRFVTSSGLESNVYLNSLDNMMPGILLCHLYQVTGYSKYMIAAQQIRNRINTYPRTSDGGLVHFVSLGDELWLDGAFMVTIFLINYSVVFNDTTYCNDECSNQLIIYNNHLKCPTTKLGWHAWDENGSASWSSPTTHLSPEIWCRAAGWYIVACIEVLERLPENHPNREAIKNILVERLEGIKNYQDGTTGLWYQVVDKGNLTDNWVEQSSGCMYTYAISKAIDVGYVNSDDYYATAKKGYMGILSNIELDGTGKTNLYGTCEGTSVGSPYSYYINRKQITNDNHGQGAFLLANEQQMKKYSDLSPLYQAEKGTLYRAVRENTNKGFTGASYVNFYDEVGSYVQITVKTTSAGTKALLFRYANGDADGRLLKISVNGSVISDSLSFIPTGAWTAWRDQNVNIALSTGVNIIKLESMTVNGGPNIDWVSLEAASTLLPLPPNSPSNLIATTASTSQINLVWNDNSSDESGFKIERKTGASGSYTQIATADIDITNYGDTSLSPGTLYYYRVRTYNTNGDSSYSNEASAATPTVPAATPTVPAATPTVTAATPATTTISTPTVTSTPSQMPTHTRPISRGLVIGMIGVGFGLVLIIFFLGLRKHRAER